MYLKIKSVPCLAFLREESCRKYSFIVLLIYVNAFRYKNLILQFWLGKEGGIHGGRKLK